MWNKLANHPIEAVPSRAEGTWANTPDYSHMYVDFVIHNPLDAFLTVNTGLRRILLEYLFHILTDRSLHHSLF